MTTTVKIEAHCAADKEVLVTFFDKARGDTRVLQDGEVYEHVVYGDRNITVRERDKEAA